ncbi:MAG: carboxypeptidase regulatory-like domain-containing protein [Gemmatimonadota bacterium]|nr:MAG: carboxypeptidase regulatory-like domain-containing protein [Gemmatimonadota bacterium]
MSARPGPRLVLDFLLLGIPLAGALLIAYQGVAKITGKPNTPGAGTSVSVTEHHIAEDSAKGLRFLLSEAEPREAAAPAQPPARPLSDDEVQRVLARVPALPVDESAVREFALPEAVVPPPVTGVTVQAEFPPAEERARPEEPAAGPLTLVRWAPEGDVEQARDVSITFSQPMVPVTSHEELEARDVPAELTPQPRGRWRWVGTRTLLFEVDAGLPMATEYRVEVPARVAAESGARLAESVSWSFRTPPPKLVESYPHGESVIEEPTFFVAFDQRVDPDAVLRHIRVTARRRDFELRRATPEEIAADARVDRMAKRAPEGYWLAFRTTEALPRNSRINVVVAEGTPSAEGPRSTESDQAFSFRTHGPLRVVDTRCGWGDRCLPGDRWRIGFSNPLDETAFEPYMVKVEPELVGTRVGASGSWLTIAGRSQPRTSYRVTLSAAIRDVFGRTLAEDANVTFKVDSVPAALTARGAQTAVLDPVGPPEFTVRSINHRELSVRLYKVEPDDWPAFAEDIERHGYGDRPVQPPGRLVFSDTARVEAAPDTWTTTPIDLRPALSNGLGHAVVVVEPTKHPKDPYERQRVYRWVQVTGIGLTAVADGREVVGWVTSLEGGAPLVGAELRGIPGGASATTDADGLATIPVPRRSRDGHRALSARRDGDVALLPLADWGIGVPSDDLNWYVLTDRPLYRPGERVHAKGWVRKIGGGVTGDVELPDDLGELVNWSARDSRGNDVAEGNARLNDLAGFDLSFELPEDVALGPVWLNVVAGGARRVRDREHTHYFQVQEFRRPEYEVSASHDPGPHIVGGRAILSVAAKYFAGGGLPEAEVRWRVAARPAFFQPPNWDDFVFGRPWGHERATTEQHYESRTDLDGLHRLRVDLLEADPPIPMSLTASAAVQDVNRQTWTAATNLIVHPAALSVGLRSPRAFVNAGAPLPVEAIVVTHDGEPVTGKTVELEAVRLEWGRVAGAWRSREMDRQECRVVSDVQPVRCEFETRAGGRYVVRATVTDDEERVSLSELTLWTAGGSWGRARRDAPVELVADRDSYQPGATAEVMVAAPFFPAEGVMTLRRAGLVQAQHFRMDGPSHILRVPIQEYFIPNVHVHVELVAASVNGAAEGAPPDADLVASGELNLSVPPRARTLELSATPRAKELEPGEETVVDIELRDAGGRRVENGDVVVAVVDEAVLALAPQELADPVETFHPQRGAGTQDHEIRRSLLLGPRPDTTAAPGEVGSVEGKVHDGDTGDPVGGVQVYLIGTEHGALSSSDGAYTIANVPPGRYTVTAELFGYTSGEQRVEVSAGEAYVANLVLETRRFTMAWRGMPVEAATLAEDMAMAPAAAGEGEGIRLRTDFAALAVFEASARTDANGHAEVTVRVPDNLTRYRVIALAAAGEKQFGKGESTITVGLPLMARPSPPRFLNFGDELELPVVIQNRADTAVHADVAVRATNLAWTAGQGRRVEVPAEGRVEVRFPATTYSAGTVRIQVAATAGAAVDAAMIELPVWTPATSEAFATYGELDEGAAAIPVAAPGGVIGEFGGLEITTSATALQALTDALLYLNAYPYECAEQLASRILAVAALRDVLTAFEAEGLPEPEVLIAAVERDMKRLEALQNYDGGFGFWRRGERSWPYVSIHVAHALARAQGKGFAIPVEMLGNVGNYLRQIDDRIPSDYPESVRRTLRAYALYVRQLLSDDDPQEARAIIAEAGLDGLPLEATGWLLAVLSGKPAHERQVAEIRRYLGNRVSEAAATAQFTSGYGVDGDYLVLHSDRRTDAVILEAMIGDQPESDLIPKLVRGLLGHRKRGRWSNTQENAFVLLALDRYFNTFEKTTPDFIARVWLGDDYAGDYRFAGRSTERHQIDIPMRWLTERVGTADLAISKEGPGRLYYRVGLRYAPADLELEPAEHGFAVERIYEAVDDPSDVRREDDGSWVIKSGARVRVKLSMAAPARRYHVALVDPLPAGLESLNPALAGMETQESWRDEEDAYPPYGLDGRRYWFWWWRWYEHENLRDERVEVFSSLVYGGVYDYSYLARATTPGAFVVPPPRAEEMYHPETFGRGASDRVIVR